MSSMGSTRRGRVIASTLIAIGALAVGCTSDNKTSPSASTGSSAVSSPAAPVASVVVEFSGSSDQTTSPFKVQEGWEIRWQTSAAAFKLGIGGDRDFGTVIDHQGEGSGNTYPVGAGTFQLHITADGPWTVRVLDHHA